jgi:hypothetical protein
MKDRIASNPLSKKGFLGQVCVTEHILCRQDSPPHGLRVLCVLHDPAYSQQTLSH